MPARHVPEEFHAVLGPVKLFRDDVEVIDRTLREVCGTVSLTVAKEFKLDGAADLASLRLEPFRDVRWFGYSERRPGEDAHQTIGVTLAPEGVMVTASDERLEMRGAAARIVEILRSRRRRALRLVGSVPALLVALPLFGAMELATTAHRYVLALCLAALWVLLLVTGATVQLGRQALVIPTFRVDNPPFWRRKKDELILAGISAMAGAVLGAAATRLFGR